MSNPAYTDRQAQWDAFHRWESSREKPALSLEDRIAWYRAASRFIRSYSPSLTFEEIESKVRGIQASRERLSHLKRSLRV
jgi:hypothetical protein